MADVFISYSRKDTAFVRRLFNALRAQGRDAWVDWQGIDYSTKWWEEICEGIERADNFVLVISPDALASEYCHREMEHARKHNKRIVSVMYREIDEKNTVGGWYKQGWEALARDNWEYLKTIQYLLFREQDNFDTAFQSLIETVDADPLHVKTHTRLTLWVREWERSGRNPSFLLRGDDLSAAENWLSSAGDKPPQPTPSQRDYIAESRRVEDELKQEAREQERRLKELQAQTEALETQTKVAAAENERLARRSRQFLRVTVMAGIMIALLVIVAVIAGLTAREAQLQGEVAQTQIANAESALAELSGLELTPLAMMTYLPPEARWNIQTAWQPVVAQLNGVQMVTVPPGCFMMGSTEAQIDDAMSLATEATKRDRFADEQPVNEVCINAPFWIDRYEVTIEQFERLGGQAENQQVRGKRPNQPRTSVTWREARAFCEEKRDARLPTEAEWEYASRGPNSLIFPWGNEFVIKRDWYQLVPPQ